MKSRLMKRVEKLEEQAAYAARVAFPTPKELERSVKLWNWYSSWRKYCNSDSRPRVVRWYEENPEELKRPDEDCPPSLLEVRIRRRTWWDTAYPIEPYPEEWAKEDVENEPAELIERRELWRYFRDADFEKRRRLWDADYLGALLPETLSKQRITSREWWNECYPDELYPLDWEAKDLKEET